MKKITKTVIVLSLFSSCLGSGPQAMAEEISVLGCNNSPRAVKEVESNSMSTIEALILDTKGSPVDGVAFDLKSSKGNFSGTTENGKLAFKTIPPGTWTLCNSSADYSVEHVNIIGESSKESVASTAILGGLTLATAGGFAIGLSSNGNSSDDTPTTAAFSEPSPTESDVGSNSGSSTNGSSVSDSSSHVKPSGTGIAKPPTACATQDCMVGGEPDALSPIS